MRLVTKKNDTQHAAFTKLNQVVSRLRTAQWSPLTALQAEGALSQQHDNRIDWSTGRQ
jgi:hypothetical protein